MSGEAKLLEATQRLLRQIVETSAYDDAKKGEDPGLLADVEFAQSAISDRDEGRASAEEIERARDLYGDDECEIDDDALTSRAPGEGLWVQAWVWLAESGCATCGESDCGACRPAVEARDERAERFKEIRDNLRCGLYPAALDAIVDILEEMQS